MALVALRAGARQWAPRRCAGGAESYALALADARRGATRAAPIRCAGAMCEAPAPGRLESVLDFQQEALGGFLLCAAPAGATPLGPPIEVGDFAGDVEGLGVGLALDTLDGIAG